MDKVTIANYLAWKLQRNRKSWDSRLAFPVSLLLLLIFEDVADRDGNVLDNPPLAEDIAYESELRDCKLIAWAADDSLLPRQGQRGFPHWAIWQERNKRFTHHFSQFFKDHRPADIASSIATRCPALHC